MAGDVADPLLTTIARLTAVQTIVMAVGALLVALALRSFRAGRWLQEREDRVGKLESRIEEAHRRMDQAGGKMSALASDITGMEDRFRDIFLSTERFEEINRQNREERERMWSEIENLWSNIRRIDHGPRGGSR